MARLSVSCWGPDDVRCDQLESPLKRQADRPWELDRGASRTRTGHKKLLVVFSKLHRINPSLQLWPQVSISGAPSQHYPCPVLRCAALRCVPLTTMEQGTGKPLALVPRLPCPVSDVRCRLRLWLLGKTDERTHKHPSSVANRATPWRDMRPYLRIPSLLPMANRHCTPNSHLTAARHPTDLPNPSTMPVSSDAVSGTHRIYPLR